MEQADKKAVVHPAETVDGSGISSVDRAAASGAVGRGFKSLRARQVSSWHIWCGFERRSRRVIP